MKWFHRLIAAVWLVALAAGCGSDGSGGCGKFSPASKGSGNPAPDFTLPLLADGGSNVSLAGLTAKGPVLLIFWASWCPTCAAEVPVLNEWQQKYAGEALQILAINVGESETKIREFTAKHQVAYPVAMDFDGDVSRRYGIIGLPVGVLVRPDGKIIYFGFSLPQNMDQLLAG